MQASFVHNLLHTLKVTAQDIEIGDERLPGNAKNAFNNTHIGLNLNAIAGAEIGLRQPDSHPPYDPNLYAAAKLVKHPNTTKAKIVKAFVNAFCFSNIYNALGKRLWTAVATESKLPYDLFEDDQGETIASLPSSDPLCKGAEAFLENIGVQRSEFSEYFDTKCYYYIDTSFGDIELMPIAINIGFSKQGTAKILQKLDLLEDTLPEFSAFFLKRKILA